MFRKNFLVAVLLGLLFTSCNTIGKQENNAVVSKLFRNEDGKSMELLFDNEKDVVTVLLQEQKIVLQKEKTASGFSYKNSDYELFGKGDDVQLIKNGKVLFEHKDDVVFIKAKNSKGDVLDMKFNNTQGAVKVYFNGGKQIDLIQQKSASGIWYKNDIYELSGKGNHYTLKKGSKTLFKN
ncbi:MAG: hypothetical protein CR988_06570 [Treponema sp.]|nr:MAG: hypothetical protein CR988_06570 [Treponema sp.]